MPSGTQPRWVQTPKVTSQLALPGLVLSASDCGSRSSLSGVALEAWISAGVRCLMNTGCLRQVVLIPCPGWILEISTSTEDKARTLADGAAWSSSGATAAAAPTPAKLQ